MHITRITNDAELDDALKHMQQMEADNQIHTEEFERLVTLVDAYTKTRNNAGSTPPSAN